MIADYDKLRDAAIKWLNGKRKFNEGIAILNKAGFKPSVMRVLERHGADGPAAAERLEHHMRDFIKLWFDKKLGEDTDVVLGVVNGKAEMADRAEEPKLMSDEMGKKLDNGSYPESVADLIRTYRADFIMRDKTMRKMAAVPEDNNEENVALRKQYSDMIQKLTDQMDKAHLQYRAYLDNGVLPSEEPAEPEKPKRVNLEKEAENMEQMSKADLQRVRKSLVDKIRRAQNMLDYQQEGKGEEPNPLPAGKRRIKYESKIARLREAVDEVEIEIAKRG